MTVEKYEILEVFVMGRKPVLFGIWTETFWQKLLLFYDDDDIDDDAVNYKIP